MDHKKPFKFYIDLDPIAYRGAIAAEKNMYVWTKGDEQSPPLKNKKEAEEWIISECWGEDPAEQGWYLSSYVHDMGLEYAVDVTDRVMDEYLATCEKFCRDDEIPTYRGWLTAYGKKNKDIAGLEDQYQYHRSGEKKPIYLKHIRNYILEKYDFAFLAKEGIEADCYVVGHAMRQGENGCALSIDKDIGQVEDCWFINTYPPVHKRECVYATALGDLWKDSSGKVRGVGFKFLALQAAAGDTADHYKGLAGYGEKKAFRDIQPLESKGEIVEYLLALYTAVAEEGYICKKLKSAGWKPEQATLGSFTYLSWNDTIEVRTPEEMLEQHFRLAYQERSSTDCFDIQKYIVGDTNEDY